MFKNYLYMGKDTTKVSMGIHCTSFLWWHHDSFTMVIREYWRSTVTV